MDIDINMNSLKENLIGLDIHHTAEAFYIRDKLMNTNNNQQIINCLKKLRYYNIDIGFETKKYILENITQKIVLDLSNNWESPIKYRSINALIEEIKNTHNYKIFLYMLNARIGRSMNLSKYISHNDTLSFYNELSLEELQIICY